MYRSGHPASMLARHITTIKKADGFTKHVAISKSTWGPILWIFFHGMGSLLATIANPELRDSYTKRMWVLTKELLETVPCPYCRGHAIEDYKSKKTIDDSKKEERRNAYQVYFFEFHNRVNTRLHKANISYEEMLEKTKDIDVTEKYTAVQKVIFCGLHKAKMTPTEIQKRRTRTALIHVSFIQAICMWMTISSTNPGVSSARRRRS